MDNQHFDDEDKLRTELTRALALLRQDPRNATLIRDIADIYAQLGEIKEAKAILSHAITDRIAVKELSFHLGVICLSVGHFGEAIALFEQLRDIGLDVPELYYNLAYAYLLDQNPEKVLALLGPIAPKFLDFPDMGLLYARALYWKGQLTEALTFAAATEHQLPDNPEPLALLGVLSLENDDLKAAYHWAKAAVAKDPEQIDAINTLGALAYIHGSLEDARFQYAQALDIVPHHPRAHLGLGIIQLHDDRVSEALGHLNNAVDADPHHLGACLALVWALMWQGELQMAQEALADLLASSEPAPEAEGAKALCDWLMGKDKTSKNRTRVLAQDTFCAGLLRRLDHPVAIPDRLDWLHRMREEPQNLATFEDFLKQCLKRHWRLKPLYH